MWNAQCDRCDMKFKNVDLKKEWNGLMVCRDCYEPRHPSDFQGDIDYSDETSVPWTRPDSDANTSATLYALEGEAAGTLTTDNKVDTYGDESPTIDWDTANNTIDFNTTLTANRTATFSGSPTAGDERLFYRTGGGAFTLDIGGVRTFPASVEGMVRIKYNGSAYEEVDYVTSGL